MLGLPVAMCLVSVVLGLKAQASCTLGKHPTNWTTGPLSFTSKILINGIFKWSASERKLTDTQLESGSWELVPVSLTSLLAYCVMLVKAINLSGAQALHHFCFTKGEYCCWLICRAWLRWTSWPLRKEIKVSETLPEGGRKVEYSFYLLLWPLILARSQDWHL